ncbi:MAG TPA: agmatine deiminase family protein, partial [Candidatus Limnocylindria bacterium]|nr:agmatine deiminase family protein [Candidatus Limnocylindria bacterium]
MPAEWARHRATWLSWPRNLETWPSYLEQVREVWVQMVCALAPYEQVYLLVNDDRMEQEVAVCLSRRARAAMENITLLKIPTVDVWMR